MRIANPATIETISIGVLVLSGAPNASSLPLEHTEVQAVLNGTVACVSVTQRFGNPFPEPIELYYIFPLPHRAAVFDFEIRVGERIVQAAMQELEQARAIYEEASSHGQRAGLLEQRRP